MEQVRASNWVTQDYLDRLQSSLAILDYSHDNIQALAERGVPEQQLNYVPIQPYPITQNDQESDARERDIDVLFYGATGCSRRKNFLNALSERIPVRIEDNLFGDDLRTLLSRTKIVINVHFYENALLETTRLSEALSHGAHVVSEKAVDQAFQGFFEDKVRFVETGDIDGFVQAVQLALEQWTEPAPPEENTSVEGMTYHVLRALHGVGLLTLNEMLSACQGMTLPAKRVVLALPEQSLRYAHASKYLLPNTRPFHGLKNVRGWRGCAQSYKFLATLALHNGFDRLGIYEDDAIFEPTAAARLDAVEAYLSQHDKEWDIFSGLLTDLHDEATILDVTDTEMGSLVTLDSVIGMVFGIYNRSALEKLADFEILGTNTQIYTIDRYLESWKPCCLTVQPPLAGHAEDLESVLWGNSNTAVVSMIERSISLLDTKMQEWQQKKE